MIPVTDDPNEVLRLYRLRMEPPHPDYNYFVGETYQELMDWLDIELEYLSDRPDQKIIFTFDVIQMTRAEYDKLIEDAD